MSRVTVIETTVRRHGRRTHRHRRALAAARRRALPRRRRGALVAADPVRARPSTRSWACSRSSIPSGCRRWRCSTCPRMGCRARAAGPGGSRSTATPGCSPWAARTVVPCRRLVGGVVAAGCARVAQREYPTRRRAHVCAEAARSSTPSRSTSSPRPHRSATTTPRRWARALDSSPRSAVTDDPLGGAPPAYAHHPPAPPAFEPAQPPRRDDDPDHDGRTTVRPAGDARTVVPSGGRHLRHRRARRCSPCAARPGT